MKLLLLGSTGSVGICVAERALDSPQHEVTLFVRSQAKLEQVLGIDLVRKGKVVEGSVDDMRALANVMRGQEGCICTAGNAGSDGRNAYQKIFRNVVEAASTNLVGPKRLWMMAGATLMNLPDTKPSLLINDLPIFTFLPYTVHSPNYEFLQDVGKTLDWSLMSPGQLHAQTPADQKKSFKSFTETAPISVPSFFLNIPLLRLFGSLFVLPQMMKFNATYENVADLMVKGLQSNGPFKNKRVGLVPSN